MLSLKSTTASIRVGALLVGAMIVLQQSSGSALAQGSHSAKTDKSWGLQTTTFATPSGTVQVRLPDDMAAGDSISGTVITEPTGTTEKERARHQDELNGYVVEMEQQKAPTRTKAFRWGIPSALATSTATLILKDFRGREVAKTEVPVQSTPAAEPPPNFHLPSTGLAGRPLQITGPFDGDLRTTAVKVGGRQAEVIAESPRKTVARSPDDVVGASQIELQKKDVVQRGEFRNIAVRITAPKTSLIRGEQTPLTVKVSGLEGLHHDMPLLLQNRTPGVVQVSGGDAQQIMIHPQMVAEGGTYTWTGELTGINPGGFNILCMVPGEDDNGLPPPPKAPPRRRAEPVSINWDEILEQVKTLWCTAVKDQQDANDAKRDANDHPNDKDKQTDADSKQKAADESKQNAEKQTDNHVTDGDLDRLRDSAKDAAGRSKAAADRDKSDADAFDRAAKDEKDPDKKQDLKKRADAKKAAEKEGRRQQEHEEMKAKMLDDFKKTRPQK
jgi:hypothetical protein